MPHTLNIENKNWDFYNSVLSQRQKRKQTLTLQKTGSEKAEKTFRNFKIEKIMAGDESKADKSKKGNKDDVESRINDIMMEGGKVIKMEVDYSETVAKKIPEAKKLAESNLNEALEMLINLEKQVFLLVIQEY